MSKKISYGLLLSLLLLLSSCATSVGMKVTRPAEIDLHGATSIAVLPFRTGTDTFYTDDYFSYFNYFVQILNAKKYANERMIVDGFQRMIEKEISRSSDLILIDSDSAERYLERGKKCPSDVFIIGSIRNFKNDIDEKSVQKKEGDEIITITSCKRSVSFDLRYQVVESSTNKVIYTDTIYFSEVTPTEKRVSDLPSPFEMARSKLYSKAENLVNGFTPHQVTRYLSLLEGPKDDLDMEKAEELAKNDLIEQSYRLYMQIYKKRNLFEAGYNAAVILEAMTEFDEALELAEELSSKFNEKKAYRLVNDIKNEIALERKYQNQIDAK